MLEAGDVIGTLDGIGRAVALGDAGSGRAEAAGNAARQREGSISTSPAGSSIAPAPPATTPG